MSDVSRQGDVGVNVATSNRPKSDEPHGTQQATVLVGSELDKGTEPEPQAVKDEVRWGLSTWVCVH